MPSPQLALSAFVTMLLFVSVGYLLRSLLDRTLLPWAARRNLLFSQAALFALRDLVPLWLALGGVAYGLRFLALPVEVTETVDQVLRAVLIASLALLALRLLSQGLRAYGEQTESPHPVGGIVERIGQLMIVLVAALMLLSTLFPEVDITPLLTGLGVAGLATALALQDTLANFFAGLYLLADRPVRIGDYARLEGGQEGYVVDVGWRSTRVRTLANNVVVIPNQKLAQSVIVNFHLPEPRLALQVPLKVGYDADPELVEGLLLAVAAEAVGQVEGLLAEPAASVRFIPGFGDWALEVTLNCQVREFADQYFVQHELRKRILARFRREGVEFALPSRTVRLADSSTGDPSRVAAGG